MQPQLRRRLIQVVRVFCRAGETLQQGTSLVLGKIPVLRLSLERHRTTTILMPTLRTNSLHRYPNQLSVVLLHELLG